MGGSTLLANMSLVKLLSSVYPDYEWLPWKFSKSPKNMWEDATSQKKFLQWVGNELKIKEMKDWYNVSLQVKSCMCGDLYIRTLFEWEEQVC